MTAQAEQRVDALVARGRLGVEEACLLAQAALACAREAEALPALAAAVESHADQASLWQWSGLLHRALDRRDLALPCFASAARLAPHDPLIAHSHARVTLEAGLPALDLFNKALRLAPQDGNVILGRVAAQLALGAGDRALADLDGVLRQNPLWVQGQRERIQLAWMLGRGDAAFDQFKQALQSHAQNLDLWQTGILLLAESGRYDLALGSIRNARQRLGDAPFFDLNEAVILSETGQTDAADRGFAAASALHHEPGMAVHLVRHELRNGRIDAAAARIDTWITQPGAMAFWPYADSVWRLTGDARRHWLHEQTGLVQVVDLADRLPPLDQLAPVLRGLHQARHEHLDQSVRGGTQTDGVLFSRIEPEIMALRAAIVDAVSDYSAALPPPDPAHPLLAQQRNRVPRFSGSWSVRLAGQGHHANHVHPAGWISSALYVSLPPGDGHKGWLALGQPQTELGLGLEPTLLIEPKPGRLVLFPSTLWHGTIPFDDGERLTVAFDVAPFRTG